MLKYEELVNTLLDELARGTYKKGDRLPTTPDLCRIYGVSNTTVKRAMDELELRGLVARRRGSGVYIKETAVPSSTLTHQGSSSQQMTGMSAEYGAQSKQVLSDVRDFSVVRPCAEIAEKLAMEPDEFAYRICRVRMVDDRPLVVEYTHMTIALIPDLRETTLHASIYAYIEQDLGLKIGSAHRAIKAVMPTNDERAWLQIGDNEPLLEVRQVAYLADGVPFEFSISRHTSDYEFYSISTR
jgi:GntR family transcriptional regulator